MPTAQPLITADGPAGGDDPALAGITQRLRTEFGDSVEMATIGAVVRACRTDLAGSPGPALPELVERLAREDLADLVRRGRARRPPARPATRRNPPR